MEMVSQWLRLWTADRKIEFKSQNVPWVKPITLNCSVVYCLSYNSLWIKVTLFIIDSFPMTHFLSNPIDSFEMSCCFQQEHAGNGQEISPGFLLLIWSPSWDPIVWLFLITANVAHFSLPLKSSLLLSLQTISHWKLDHWSSPPPLSLCVSL